MKNVLKMEGFGVFVTYIDGKVWTSDIQPKGHAELDPNDCIVWHELTDPPNQEFLNAVNEHWGLTLKTSDYGKYMSISECLWYVKNLKEVHK